MAAPGQANARPPLDSAVAQAGREEPEFCSGGRGKMSIAMPFSPALVHAHESDSVDRKVDASSPEKIVHDIGAFANTHGGHVIVGMADDGEVVGVGDFQKAEAAIVQSVVSRTDPQLVPTILSYLHASGKELLIVEVNYFEGAEPLKIRVKDAWKVYERVGSVSLVVDDDRLEQMRRERRGTDTLDQAGAAVGMDALDQALIAEMFASVGLAVDEALLQSSEVARTINGKLTPSNAGLLLFGYAPQTVFQDAYMRCGRYSGTSKTHRTADRDLTQQPLLRVIDGAERFLAEHTGEIDVALRGMQQQSIPHYSPDVVRELLVNAIAHADYSQQAVFSLQIFSDRLELTSPGRFPYGITEEQVRNGVSRPRNRAIVTVLRRLRYVEQSGRVWDKARQANAEHGYPLPRWREVGLNVRVTVPVHPAVHGHTDEAVASAAAGGPRIEPARVRTRKEPSARAAQIRSVLADGEKTVAAVASAIGVSERQARRLLTQMSDSGLVRQGDGANGDRRFGLSAAVDART